MEGERGPEWHQDVFFSHIPRLYFNALIATIVQKIHLYIPIVVTLYASHPSVELPHLSLDPADYDYFNSLTLFFLTSFFCLV